MNYCLCNNSIAVSELKRVSIAVMLLLFGADAVMRLHHLALLLTHSHHSCQGAHGSSMLFRCAQNHNNNARHISNRLVAGQNAHGLNTKRHQSRWRFMTGPGGHARAKPTTRNFYYYYYYDYYDLLVKRRWFKCTACVVNRLNWRDTFFLQRNQRYPSNSADFVSDPLDNEIKTSDHQF